MGSKITVPSFTSVIITNGMTSHALTNTMQFALGIFENTPNDDEGSNFSTYSFPSEMHSC